MEVGKLMVELENKERIRQLELTMLEKESEKLRAETEREFARMELERFRIQCEHEQRMEELRINESTSGEGVGRTRRNEVPREEQNTAMEREGQPTANLDDEDRSRRNMNWLASGIVIATVSVGLGVVAYHMGSAAGDHTDSISFAGAVTLMAKAAWVYKEVS